MPFTASLNNWTNVKNYLPLDFFLMYEKNKSQFVLIMVSWDFLLLNPQIIYNW